MGVKTVRAVSIPSPPPPPKPRKYVLNRADYFRLCQWISSLSDEDRGNYPVDAIASKATDALGFLVKERNIKSAALTTGVTLSFRQVPQSYGIGGELYKRIARIEMFCARIAKGLQEDF